MATISQRSFTGGVLSPYLWARTDFSKYQTSAKKIKNFIPLKYGGLQNRSGFQYYGKAGDLDSPVRLIPFDIGLGVSYALEFGHEYMRVYDSDGQVTYGNQTITNITYSPTRITHSGVLQGPSEEVTISGLGGAIGELFNGRNFRLSVVSGTEFDLLNLDGSPFVPATTPAYSSGGVFNEVYELTLAGLESQYLFAAQYAQDINTLILVHSEISPRIITYTSATSWSTSSGGTPNINKPGFGLAYSHSINGAPGSTFYRYLVTCEYAGQENDWTPSVLYINANTGNLSTYSFGGANATLSPANSITLNARSYVLNSMPQASSSVVFNYYKQLSSGTNKYGYIGSSLATWNVSGYYEGSLTDIGFTPEEAIQPPAGVIGGYPYGDDNFNYNSTFSNEIDSDFFPSTVSFAQQRLFFGASNLYPDSVWASALGAPGVFYGTTPTTDSSALFFKPFGAKFNKIKHIVPASKLILLTENGELVINPDGSILTPTNINVSAQSYNGSSNLKPIIINESVLYVQAKNSAVRDLSFNFNIDGFTGDEISIFASHLFEGFELLDWCYQKTPNSIVWAARSDGVLLSLTYLKEQQVLAWAEHETDGLVKSVCCIPGFVEDELFLVVQRNGKNQIEKLSTRFLNTNKQKVVTEFGVEKTKFVDDSASVSFVDNFLTYDGRNAVGSFTMAISSYLGGGFTSDDTVTVTASASYFNSSMVGNELHIFGSENSLYRLEITAYVSTTVVRCVPIRNIPTELQGQSTSHWSMAVDEITGLWHLEGQDVAVQADGFVDANPLNDSYSVLTVEDGKILLPGKRALVHVGLPYMADLKTLEIDTVNGETTVDKKNIVNEATVYVEKTRALWAGSEEPEDSNVKGDLTEMKFRNSESMEVATSLKTGVNSVVIKSVHGRGEVFIRQIDPAPANILSVNPSGLFPIR